MAEQHKMFVVSLASITDESTRPTQNEEGGEEIMFCELVC